MKKVLNYMMIALGILCCSCSNWLDVRPRNEMKEDDLYKTPAGFRQVLSGVYLELADEALYGKNVTMTFPEYLAQHWTVENNKLSGFLAAYDYRNAEVEGLIGKIWKSYYNVIAHLNNLLQQLEKNGSVLTEKDRKLIKGEALGLRGFLHLELLRMFGPVPETAVAGEITIPYVTELTKETDKLVSVSYEEVVRLIGEDLDKAEEYLSEDPFIEFNYDFLNHAGSSANRLKLEDLFYYYRQNHFNIYAVQATKARYYLWIANRSKACEYALKVIRTKNSDDTEKFRLTVESDLSGLGKEDRTFTREQVFSVYNSRLQDIVDGLFFQYNGLTKTANFTDDVNGYDKTTSPNDIRNKGDRYWGNEVFAQGSFRVYKKYKQNVSDELKNVVPLIRLSEMYLIAMETFDSEEQVKELFRTFRISRNMSAGVEAVFNPVIQIEREYRKEFYAEGQMFWYYKRKNTPKITWGLTSRNAVTMDAAKYVIPKPDNQIVFE